MSLLYKTAATARAGRNGSVRTDDGLLELNLTYPKEMGGKGDATNPEQLFAAGYSACFSNAIIFIAQQQKLKLPEAPVTATVKMNSTEQGGFVLAVDLDVQLALPDDQAKELVAAAHQVCPYSNATRGNIAVSVAANGQAIE